MTTKTEAIIRQLRLRQGQGSYLSWEAAAELEALSGRLDRIAELLPPNDDPYDGTANTVIGPIARGEEQ